jgi:ADP-ribose pyrophosphatase
MTFEILGHDPQYQGHAFDVVKVQVRLPDGRVRPYDLVQHRDSISVVPVDAQGQILFVAQYRIGAGQELLELPAGVMEDAEDARVCAERELREETGYAAREWIELGHFYLAPGYCTERMVVFLARDLYPSPLRPDADEFLRLRRLGLEEAYAMAQRGEIHDAKTLAALLLAQPHLRQG